jgi:uncharacterized protein YndB with AHSA1/START domain
VLLNGVSSHLKVLERARLIRRARRGRNQFLTLEGKTLREIARWALRYERYFCRKEPQAMTLTRQKTIELTLTRSISTSPAEVYDVWIDPKTPGGPWFGTAKAIVQPVVDGLFYHFVQFEGHDWAHYGRFVTLDRPSRIEHTWVSEATRGLESRVSLTLDSQEDGTLVTLHHENLPDDDMGRRHREGWGFVLDAIALRFARQSRG